MPDSHLSKRYDMDLEAIRSDVLAMGGLVQSQFADALRAFKAGDAALAREVMKNDEKVNHCEIKLDDECSHLIVRRQPTANDLRMVVATLKMITDLERIGDEACAIARAAKSLAEREFSGVLDQYAAIKVMADKAGQLLNGALDAFARMDASHASELIAQDQVVDQEFRTAMRSMITFMMEDTRTVSPALDVIWASKAIERIGDHAKNIAEYVIYVVEGKDVRHMPLAALGHHLVAA